MSRYATQRAQPTWTYRAVEIRLNTCAVQKSGSPTAATLRTQEMGRSLSEECSHAERFVRFVTDISDILVTLVKRCDP